METSINDSITIFLLIYVTYLRFSLHRLLHTHIKIAKELTVSVKESITEICKAKESTK